MAIPKECHCEGVSLRYFAEAFPSGTVFLSGKPFLSNTIHKKKGVPLVKITIALPGRIWYTLQNKGFTSFQKTVPPVVFLPKDAARVRRHRKPYRSREEFIAQHKEDCL